jgi:integrase
MMSLTTSSALDRFKVEYQTFNGLTEARCKDQLRALRELCAFAEVEDPIEVTPDTYRRWILDLSNRKAAVTVKKDGMLVRAFFGFAFDAGLYEAEDLLTIRRVPFPDHAKPMPRPYSSKEIKRIWPALAEAHPLDDGKFLKRWRKGTSPYKRIEHHANHLQLTAVVRLALDCGLRREEIFDLSLDDMHYDNAFVVVQEGKGEKPREVPYTKAARAAVRAWIEFRAELKPTHDRPWLSLTKVGPPGVWLRPMNFRRFSMYLKDIGPDWTLHRLRHTCATTWLRSGMKVEKVSRLLGHSSIQQTMVYTELVGEDVQREVERHEDRFEEQVA